MSIFSIAPEKQCCIVASLSLGCSHFLQMSRQNLCKLFRRSCSIHLFNFITIPYIIYFPLSCLPLPGTLPYFTSCYLPWYPTRIQLTFLTVTYLTLLSLIYLVTYITLPYPTMPYWYLYYLLYFTRFHPTYQCTFLTITYLTFRDLTWSYQIPYIISLYHTLAVSSLPYLSLSLPQLTWPHMTLELVQVSGLMPSDGFLLKWHRINLQLWLQSYLAALWSSFFQYFSKWGTTDFDLSSGLRYHKSDWVSGRL